MNTKMLQLYIHLYMNHCGRYRSFYYIPISHHTRFKKVVSMIEYSGKIHNRLEEKLLWVIRIIYKLFLYPQYFRRLLTCPAAPFGNRWTSYDTI